jgi:hypothetical protein
MLRKIITPLLITLFGLMSFSAQAGIEKGDKTISIFGSLTSPSDGDDQLFLSAAGGMFVTDIKQFLNETVAVNYQLQYVDAGDYDATIASVGFSIFLE